METFTEKFQMSEELRKQEIQASCKNTENPQEQDKQEQEQDYGVTSSSEN